MNKISHVVKHVRKYKQHYLLGTLGCFAVVKTVLLFAGFFGLMWTNITFAAGPLNSGNVTQAPYNCTTGLTTCNLN